MHALASLFLSAFAGIAPLPTPTPQEHGKTSKPVYDEQADAKKDVDAAVARARANNRRVLVVWGGNWCGWCIKLHGLFEKDKDVARELLYEYDVVSVDVGHFDKHTDLAASLGADIKSGVPFLTVLDGQGKVLANQETGALEAGDKHDPAKVMEFLKKHQAPYEKAVDVRDRALATAAAQKKATLVTFGAPWCGWCHRFEDWLARPEIAALVGKYMVVQKIDVERTVGGQELCDGYGGKDSGIPWFAFLDASGKKLATSTDTGENLGCPYKVEEVTAFAAMLKKALPAMPAEDVATLERSLNAQREEIEKQKKSSG